MKKLFVMLASCMPLGVMAATEPPASTPERTIESAQLLAQERELPVLPQAGQLNFQYSAAQLATDPQLTEQLLNQAIAANQGSAIRMLLPIYQRFAQHDPILVTFAQAKLAKQEGDLARAIALYREILRQNGTLNPVRIELAIALFNDFQNNDAQGQFAQALTQDAVPADIAQLIRLYQSELAKRSQWQINASASYVHDNNVNTVSDAPYIENTGFAKGASMLPQRANGIAYALNVARDFNLAGSHYLHIANNLHGKNYWDNHSYDDISNRTYLGYANKHAQQRWQLLPFYERQWYGNQRYKAAYGARAEYNRWLNARWQFSGALEHSKQRYMRNANLDGNNTLASVTLLWRSSPQQSWSFGLDASRENTHARHLSYDLATVRLGWGRDWQWAGLSTRFNLSAARREYQANWKLGSVFSFDRKRTDKIYLLNATLWKRDWQLLGITPKVNISWKKQQSNFATLYSYVDRRINLVFEKNF